MSDLNYEYKKIGKYTRIRTDCLYPDGNVIDVFHDEENGIVTDLGELRRYMSMFDISPVAKTIFDIAASSVSGCKVKDGQLFITVKECYSLGCAARDIAFGVEQAAEVFMSPKEPDVG